MNNPTFFSFISFAILVSLYKQMKFGKNQLKPKGFNYRPFYLNEQEEERKRRFGHLHQDNKETSSFKPSFKKKKADSIFFFSPKMIRLVIFLLLLISIFLFLCFKEFYIPKKIMRIFEQWT